MGLENRLEDFKLMVLKDMQDFLAKCDTKKLIICSRVLESCEALCEEVNKIECILCELEETYSKHGKMGDTSVIHHRNLNTQFVSQAFSHTTGPSTTPHKESLRSDSLKKARQTRDDILQLLANKYGVHLSPRSKTVYITKTGKPVGIAFATERTSGRWFLGLPIHDYFGIILVCEVDSSNQKHFVLPESFWVNYGELLSRSGNQVKFNIRERGGHYELLTLGGESVAINRFLDSYGALAPERTMG